MRFPRNAHDPSPAGLSRDAIFAEAAKFATRIGFVVGTPCSTYLKDLGGSLGRMNDMTDVIMGYLPSEHSDCLVVYGENDFAVLLSPSDNTEEPKTNFEIAKALGYLVLHAPQVRLQHGKNAAMLVRYQTKTKADKVCLREALQFAYGLLAPRERIMVEWKRSGGNIHNLREIFRMPAQIIQGLHEAFADEDAKAA